VILHLQLKISDPHCKLALNCTLDISTLLCTTLITKSFNVETIGLCIYLHLFNAKALQIEKLTEVQLKVLSEDLIFEGVEAIDEFS